MDVRIGIINASRELNFETKQSASEFEATITKSLESKAEFLRLTDDKGCIYVVPVASLGYIEIGSEEARRVGFVA